jgi:hypothetical protein
MVGTSLQMALCGNRAKSGPRGLHAATGECCSSIGPRRLGCVQDVLPESTEMSST